MGIANFNTYVDKALKWPLSRYDSDRRPEESDAGGAPEGVNSPSSAHPCRVFASICDNGGTDVTDGKNVRSSRCTDERKTTYGICVDLSSFVYGVIADVVSEVRRENDTPRQKRMKIGVEVADESVKVFDESVLYETMTVQRIPGLVTSESMTGGENSNTTADRRSQNVLRLDECVIEECVRRCVDRIYNVIGGEAINNAHYFALHFDENTTICKWYVQFKRRVDSQTIVDRDSLRRVFQNTIRSVRTRILFDLKTYLHQRMESSCTDRVVEARVSALLSDDACLAKVVDEKMLFYNGDDGIDGRKQRYLFGEGEWKCFYCICDVDTEASNTGDNVKNYWYVFGHDSDIGLGTLLYSSDVTRVHYVNSLGTVIAPPVEVCARKDWNAYKTLHFLSLCLIGNDYVPRLVNESTKNITALGNEVDSMLASDDEHCESRVTRLSCVFAVHERCGENDAVTNRTEFAKAFAYVIVRLLRAVYGTVHVQTADVDDILLRCNDNKRYTLADCLTVFTTRTLWYLSYCAFYKHLDDGRRKALLNAATFMSNAIHLDLPGLPMRRCFFYNERRLIDGEQFETANLADMRQAIKSLTYVQLVEVLESRTLDVLESE